MNNNNNEKDVRKSRTLVAIYIIFALGGLLSIFGIGLILILIGCGLAKKVSNEINAIQEKADSIDDTNKLYTDTLAKCNQKLSETDAECSAKISKADAEYSAKISDLESSYRIEQNKYNAKIEKLENKLQAKNEELNLLQSQCSDAFVQVVTPFSFDNDITSAEYKSKLSMLKTEENTFIKSDDVFEIIDPLADIKKSVLNADKKQLLRSFNSEVNYILSGITIKNADSCRSKIQKSFETLNKFFETNNIRLSIKMLEYKLQELDLQFAYLKKIEIEREQQKAIKEQMVEEEKVRREIEREKAKLDKEETQFKNEVSKLMKYMQNASDIEKQLYVDKIKELEEKLKGIESDRENVLEREQNTRAGFVYIISNIGSFGENVYKIGMTRRLEPMDRVKELGSASVPFEFDVHAMIFSDDAPALENILHKTFEKNAVNKVNLKKEFFRVNLKDIEKVVKENYNATVEFTELAKAEQYRETLKLEQSI